MSAHGTHKLAGTGQLSQGRDSAAYVAAAIANIPDHNQGLAAAACQSATTYSTSTMAAAIAEGTWFTTAVGKGGVDFTCSCLRLPD